MRSAGKNWGACLWVCGSRHEWLAFVGCIHCLLFSWSARYFGLWFYTESTRHFCFLVLTLFTNNEIWSLVLVLMINEGK